MQDKDTVVYYILLLKGSYKLQLGEVHSINITAVDSFRQLDNISREGSESRLLLPSAQSAAESQRKQAINH